MKLYEEFKEYESLWEDTSNSLSQIERYKSLLAQIERDCGPQPKVIQLSDTVLNTRSINWSLRTSILYRIIFDPEKNNYLLQIRDRADYPGDYRNLTWGEVLYYLEREDLMFNTDLCS